MSESQNHYIVQTVALNKQYLEGPSPVSVLEQVDLAVHRGELVAIIGASGSGKSTLLHLMGGLDVPTSGSVWVNGKELSQLDDSARAKVRNQTLGFVYQFHHLLPEFSAVENVAMPLMIGGWQREAAQNTARDILVRAGLSHRLDHRPAELSGGERQRTAIARALVTRPACVLADEPTGNLDRRNAMQVIELMIELNREAGTSLVMVTHDVELAAMMDRSVRLVDGSLTEN
jgi:lipoprotein-releasing system ATP-binding protein